MNPQSHAASKAGSSNGGNRKKTRERRSSTSRNASKSEPLSSLTISALSQAHVMKPAPVPHINPWLQGTKSRTSAPAHALLDRKTPSPPASQEKSPSAKSSEIDQGESSVAKHGPEYNPAHRRSKIPVSAPAPLALLERKSPSPPASREKSPRAKSSKKFKGESSAPTNSPEAAIAHPRIQYSAVSASSSSSDSSSHHSSSSNAPQPAIFEPEALVETRRSTRSPSGSSEASRTALIAAAPRAEANLFVNPIGADVIVCAGGWSWKVHRNILIRESIWFKDNLPELTQDEDVIRVTFNCAAETVGYCLRYMYVQKLEELLESKPSDLSHLPRCVLCYCAAVFLRVKGMIQPLLRIVERTAQGLCEDFGELYQSSQGKTLKPNVSNEDHLYNALDIMYSQRNQTLMEPMRIAMVTVLEATLFFQLHQSSFMEKLITYPWIPQMQADYAEYRRRTRFDRQGLTTTSDEALDIILAHPELNHTATIEVWQSPRPRTDWRLVRLYIDRPELSWAMPPREWEPNSEAVTAKRSHRLKVTFDLVC